MPVIRSREIRQAYVVVQKGDTVEDVIKLARLYGAGYDFVSQNPRFNVDFGHGPRMVDRRHIEALLQVINEN